MPRPAPRVVRLRLGSLLCQPPEAVAFLEAVLANRQTGLVKLHVKDGEIRAWAFAQAGRVRKHFDTRAPPAVE